MKLVLGRLNATDLRVIRDQGLSKTTSVYAAVAYANEASLIFDWCWENDIPLKYWGRFDHEVPVSTPILEKFVRRQSPNFQGKVMRRFHPKVIWWKGYGCYIGSANLTDSAWYTNIEAGCFLTEKQLDEFEVRADLTHLFEFIDEHSSLVTPKLVELMKSRRKKIFQREQDDADERKKFWDTSLVKPWSGLLTTPKKKKKETEEIKFLDEWLQTMELIRQLSNRAMQPENRPKWVSADLPKFMVGDQFIHAYYEEHVIIKGKAEHEYFYEQNKANPERAIKRALKWWSEQDSAPSNEDELLYDRLPWVRNKLSRQIILELQSYEWEQICFFINSIHDYSRQVSNQQVGLPDDGTSYTMTQKTKALAKTHWQKRNNYGQSLPELLNWLFYSDGQSTLPERIWEADKNPDRKLELLGLSALGELSGWALPDQTPARNNRTSKGLKALGLDVKIYSE